MKQTITNKAPWLTALMAGAMLCSCSNEATLQPEPILGVEGDYPVVLNLDGLTPKGVTRAYSADGQRFEALDRERTVNSLYAVAFYDGSTDSQGNSVTDGSLYKVFKVTLPGDTYVPADSDVERPHFDMTTSGKFKVWFVANPGDELLAKIYNENDENGCGTGLTQGVSTEDVLRKLTTDDELDSRVGNLSVSHDNFLLFSVDSKSISTALESVNRVTVTMERASARFDVINQVDGVAITKLEFTNPYTSTLLDEPTSEADQDGVTVATNPVTVDFTTELGGEGLVGSLQTPGYYAARVYAYEHLTTNGAYALNAPEIELTYTTGTGEEAEVKTTKITFGEPLKYDSDISEGTTEYTANGQTYTIDGQEHKQGEYVIANSAAEGEEPNWVIATDENNKIPIQRNHLYRIRLVTKEDVNKPIVIPLLEVLDWTEAEILTGETWKNDLSQADLNRRLYINRFNLNGVAEGFDPQSSQVLFAGESYGSDNPLTAGLYSVYDPAWAGEYDEAGVLTKTALFKHQSDLHHTQFRLPTADELCYLEFEAEDGDDEYKHTINVFGETLHNGFTPEEISQTDCIVVRFKDTEQYSAWNITSENGNTVIKVRALLPDLAIPGDRNGNKFDLTNDILTSGTNFWNDDDCLTFTIETTSARYIPSSENNCKTTASVKKFWAYDTMYSKVVEVGQDLGSDKMKVVMVTAYDEVAAQE